MTYLDEFKEAVGVVVGVVLLSGLAVFVAFVKEVVFDVTSARTKPNDFGYLALLGVIEVLTGELEV